MAVSSNYTFQLNRNDLLRRAFQLSGVLAAEQHPLSDDIAMAADFLNLELDAIQAEGINLRAVTRATLPLVDGTATYTLPPTVLDVLEPAALLVGSETLETPVELIDRARYTTLTDKTSEGRPVFMYVEKGPSVTATFWPKPDATMTLTYQKVGFLADSDAANVDTDMARHWHKPLMFCVAAMVARSRNQPQAKVDALLAEGERLKRISRTFEQEHGDFVFQPCARSGGFGRW